MPSVKFGRSSYLSCDYEERGITYFVGWAACFGTSLFVTYKYLLINATLSLVLKKHASGTSINFNLAIPVAARHETTRGGESLIFFFAAWILAFIANLISFSASPAWPGSTHMNIISLS